MRLFGDDGYFKVIDGWDELHGFHKGDRVVLVWKYKEIKPLPKGAEILGTIMGVIKTITGFRLVVRLDEIGSDGNFLELLFNEHSNYTLHHLGEYFASTLEYRPPIIFPEDAYSG
jgi:hypothetical protein